MTNEIIKKDSFSAIGIKFQGEMHNANQISQFWDRFMNRIGEISHIDADDPVLGMVFAEGSETHYYAAVPVMNVGSIPKGMELKEVKGGEFLRVIHKGPISAIKQTYENFFKKPSQNIALGIDRPLLEIYGEKFHGERNNSEVELLFPVNR